MKYQRSGLLLNRQYMAYLFPTVMSAVSVLLASFVDGILASKICGSETFNAINVSEPVILFMQAVFFLFGIGGAVRISVAKGRREYQKANALFSLAFYLCIAVSVVVAVLGLIFLDPVCRLMCREAKLLPLVIDYTRINLIGAPFMIFVPMMSFLIRTDGMPRLSANILLVANILNLLMDVVYMKFFHMGIQGAALATVTGYVLGLALVIFYMRSKKRTLKLRFPKGKDWTETGALLTGGIASVINTVLLFTKELCLNNIVMANGGDTAMLAFSVCNFMVSFAAMFISGGSDTMTPLVGLLYGEKDQRGMDYVFRRTMIIVMSCCTVLIALLMVFPNAALWLFNVKKPEAVAIGIPAIRIFAISLFGLGFSYTLMNYYQTTSHKGVSVTISFLRGIVLIVPVALLFARLFGLTGIWIAFPVTEALTIGITILLCLIIVKRSNGTYQGILLKEVVPEGEAVFDLTLTIDQLASADVSQLVEQFCLEHQEEAKRASFAGLVAEEMLENIRLYNEGEKKVPQADLVVRLQKEELLLLVRDNGKTLSSIDVEEGTEEFTNLKMLHAIAKNIDYSRTLGLNSTAVTL